jgi:hypothetical protein
MVIGPLSMLLGKNLLPQNIDPLFLGIAMNFITVLVGFMWESIKEKVSEKWNTADSRSKP